MRQTVVTLWFIRLVGLMGLMGLTTGTLEAQDPVATMYDEQVTLVEDEVVSLAKAMPADAYDFAPTEGRFAGVRSFGEQVTHLATMIYMTSALVLEERSPYGPGTHNNGPDDLRSKDDVLPYLTSTRCHRPSVRCHAPRWRPASHSTASITTARWSSTHA